MTKGLKHLTYFDYLTNMKYRTSMQNLINMKYLIKLKYLMCETEDFPGTSVASEMPLLVTTDIKLVDPSTEQASGFN